MYDVPRVEHYHVVLAGELRLPGHLVCPGVNRGAVLPASRENFVYGRTTYFFRPAGFFFGRGFGGGFGLGFGFGGVLSFGMVAPFIDLVLKENV